MYQENKLINKNEFSYEDLKLMEEHAKKYDMVSDKKNFLKSITPYEQKLVLLHTTDPYEVLNYLDELDLKNSRIILSNLEYHEISKIIGLLNSDDKKRFYATFSDLDLVNKFIAYDKNASDHIENLTLDRKVEILNSTDSKTEEAATKIYDSINEEDKEVVVESVSSVEAKVALDNVVSSDESHEINNEEAKEAEAKEKEAKEEPKEEAKEEPKEEEKEEEPKEEAKEEPKEEAKEEEPKEKLEVFDSEENKEEQFENIVVQEEPSPVLEMFEQAKKDCEQQLIQAVLNNVKETVIEENAEKTL